MTGCQFALTESVTRVAAPGGSPDYTGGLALQRSDSPTKLLGEAGPADRGIVTYEDAAVLEVDEKDPSGIEFPCHHSVDFSRLEHGFLGREYVNLQ